MCFVSHLYNLITGVTINFIQLTLSLGKQQILHPHPDKMAAVKK